MSWRIRGSYFESCNCDAICPAAGSTGCPADARPTGSAWSPLLADRGGAADESTSTGLPVALAIRYSDDEQGSPWTWILYLDTHARRSSAKRSRASTPGAWAATPRSTSRGPGRRASWSPSGR